MTKIKCTYEDNWYEVKRKGAEPIYCVHRGEDGYCTMEEIEMYEEDSVWAVCAGLQCKDKDTFMSFNRLSQLVSRHSAPKVKTDEM